MNRHKIYECLENGEALSSKQLAELTGLSLQTVQESLSAMSSRGFIESIPVRYALSESGIGMAKRARERRETIARPLLVSRSGKMVNSVFALGGGL